MIPTEFRVPELRLDPVLSLVALVLVFVALIQMQAQYERMGLIRAV